MTEKKDTEKNAENSSEKKAGKKAEKEAKKMMSEDVENFFRDVWGKVVEYASLGAEEATKVSASAKTRVDIETLKFKRGKLLKMLGERYWELVAKDSSLTVSGTGEIIRQIKSLDREIRGLEKEINKKDAKAAKKPAAKKAQPRKAAASKKGTSTRSAAAGKSTARKKTTTRKTTRKPAASRESPRGSQ